MFSSRERFENGRGSDPNSPKQLDTPLPTLNQRDSVESDANQNTTPLRIKPQSFIRTALHSSTTYSSLGSALYSTIFISFSNPFMFAITALPTLAYLTLGYIALRNEHKKKNSDDTKASFLNPIKFLNDQLQNPAIFRYYRSGILAYQAVLAIYRLNFFDTALFLLGVVGNYFAGRETANFSQKNSTTATVQEATNDTTKKNILLKISSPLLTSPGFYWICWGVMAGFRDLGFGSVLSTLANPSASNPLQFIATSFSTSAMLIAGLYFARVVTCAYRNSFKSKEQEKAIALNFSACQISLFALANLPAGNFIVSSSLLLLSLSSFALGRQIIKKLATVAMGALLFANTGKKDFARDALSNKDWNKATVNLLVEAEFSRELRKCCYT